MEDHRGQNVVFLELGVGYNTPGIIKYNFWQYAHNWRNAFYVCINKGDAYVPKEIENKAAAASQPKNADEETTSKNWKNGQKRKLKFTYQEQKDYESIEGEMAALEDKIATLEADFSKYASDFVKLNELTQEKEAAEQQLEEKMERWMYLEDLAARIERGEEN